MRFTKPRLILGIAIIILTSTVVNRKKVFTPETVDLIADILCRLFNRTSFF